MIVIFAGFANMVDVLIAGIAIGCLLLVLLWCTPSCPSNREGKHLGWPFTESLYSRSPSRRLPGSW